MNKILQCITLSEAGGAQEVVKYLCEGFYKENKIILAAAPNGELLKWAENFGILIYPLPDMKREISPIDDLKTLIQLINIIRSEKPDIVHCHSWKAGVLGRIAAFFCGVEKIFYTIHGWSILSKSNKVIKAIFIFIEKILAYMTTKLICVCEEDRRLGLKLIAKPDKICTIYNGIEDITRFNLKSIREIYNIPKEATLLCTVARLASQKRCLETAYIMSNIIKEKKDTYFLFIGDGPLLKQMEDAIIKLGIEGRFILTGNQDNVADYLNSVDIFLLLSNYEGLPISLLEAMCMSLPIIASDVGGIREIVFNNINGYIVSNDESEIEKRIIDLIDDSKKRKGYGKESRIIFESNFNVKNMIDKYQELYK